MLSQFPITNWPNPQFAVQPKICRRVKSRTHNGTQKHYDVQFVFNTLSPSPGQERTTSHPNGSNHACPDTSSGPEGPGGAKTLHCNRDLP